MEKFAHGHSLFEIISILAVLGIAIAVSTPHFSAHQRKLRLEAEKIVSFLKQAQALAFYSTKKVKVRISTKQLSLQNPELVNSASQRILKLAENISVTNSSHAKLTFSPAGTGTASNITIESYGLRCQITNSIFNRLRYQC